MTRRVFAVISRGMTDKTAVCVYPWELQIMQLVHNDAVEEISIDKLCDVKQGALRIEKIKLKHTEHPAPDLREQYEIMSYVDPESDPAKDPEAEYDRLANLYGLDKEFPIPVVERVYGPYNSGNFKRALEDFAKDGGEKPNILKAMDEGMSRAPTDMTVAELRTHLKERGIKFTYRDGQIELAKKLEEALAPA